MRSTYAKFYFAVMALMFIGSLFTGPHGPMDVLNTLVAAFILVAGYGYLSQTGIGSAGIWKVYFYVFVLLAVAGLVYGVMESWAEVTASVLFILMFVVVLWLPLVAMLWLYAFSERDLWNPIKTEA